MNVKLIGCCFFINALSAIGGSCSAQETSSLKSSIVVGQYEGFDGYSRAVTTNSPEGQKWFNQGIQLLYGFNHDEAIRSFEKAAQIDPQCAMAWFGIAYARGLHINNPAMSEEQSKRAYEATQKAVAAVDNESPVERALIEAITKRYAWPVPQDRRPLDEAYADAMEKVWHQFPRDADVGALFAESMMNLQPWDLWTDKAEPKGRALEVVSVLEKTLQLHPSHPGANHFYIHAIEASPWPDRGAPAADRLSNLVPGSGHLVHMPSHIYIRVGRYGDAVNSNQRAIAADKKYFALAPAPEFYNIYYLHNMHFLAYGAMMQGRYQLAIDASREIEKTIPQEFLKAYAVVADGFMPTSLHVLIRFGKWNEILNEPQPPDWRLLSLAEWHFARSIAHTALGNLEQAQKEIDEIALVSEKLTDEWRMGNNPAKEVVEIAMLMAKGELAFRKGHAADAFVLLSAAVEKEDHLRYDEPPGWMQPVRHALGALLLADGKAKEAEEVYREDLIRHPNNAWSLLGLQQSLKQQSKTGESESLAEVLGDAWKLADIKPVASCFCHPDARNSTAGNCCDTTQPAK